MSLYIQDPEDPDTTYLLEILLSTTEHGIGGGAAFAWATAKGAELFLGDKTFVDFATKYDFGLVVGIDSITNEKALESLEHFAKSLPRLTVKIFMHEFGGTIFHPKFTWFRNDDGGVIISGSGNLTDGGLRGNWEAFTVSELDDAGIEAVEEIWANWCEQHDSKLYDPSDDAVVARAKKNVGWAGGGLGTTKKKSKPKLKIVGKPSKIAKVAKISAPPDEVLVAEIPKGGPRWNQANFNLENYEGFFGAKVGVPRMMFFRHMDEDGTIQPTEVRPSVAVKSSNYRFELGAGAGLDYPKDDRPISVFVRESVRNFRYRLLMPGDDGHFVMAKFLQKNWSGAIGHVKRVRTTVSVLESLWPESTLWHIEKTPSE